MFLRTNSIFIVFLFFSCNSRVENLSLPSVFSDHMVLQRETEVSFWGKSNPNEKIEIKGSWGKSSSVIANNDGKWVLKLATPSAGGPYEVLVNDSKNSIIYKDVLIGEVWLASGQSNMQWKLNQCKDCIDNQDEEIANANYEEIRFFNNPMDLSMEVVKNQSWRKVKSEYAREREGINSKESFSATGYFFARELYKKLNVPIGIIGSSWGGTRVEAWTSPKKLKQIYSENLELLSGIDLSYKEYENEIKRYNDSVSKINRDLLGFKIFDIPEWSGDSIHWKKIKNGWSKMDLNDLSYSKGDFDDSSWPTWIANRPDPYDDLRKGSFETVFDYEKKLLSDGVIWFRTSVNIDDNDEDYTLVFKDGIDDSDQTFFNGNLIGNTFSYNKERNYLVSKEIINKGINSIAIRITDLRGIGGFNGPVLLKNSSGIINIPYNSFRFKHHAFVNALSSFMVHNLNLNELLNISDSLENKILIAKDVNSPNAYSRLYRNILSNVVPYTIKGTIWYQGESNVSNYNEYQTLFSAMIDDWRETWGYDFPFYYVQIAPFPEQGNIGVREAQRKTLESTKNTGMAVLMDIGEEDDIHPHNKQDVGKRLALLALDKQYGFNYVSSGPKYKSHQANSRYLYVDFDSVGSGLDFIGGENGFEIAGKDNNFYPATAKIINNRIRLYSKNVKRPINVRYGWKNWTVGTLFNKEGLPASSFSSINFN